MVQISGVTLTPGETGENKYQVGKEYFTSAACDDASKVVDANGDAIALKYLPVSTEAYYVKVTGTGHSYFYPAKFYVEKAPLTITYTGTLEKDYGVAQDPDLDKTKISISGWKNDDETQANIDLIKNSLDYTYADGTQDVIKDANWDTANSKFFNYVSSSNEGSGYELKWTATELPNYEFAKPTNTMKVKQIPLSTGSKFTFDSDKKEYTYTGAAQLPEYTIKYKNPQNQDMTLKLETTGAVPTGDFHVNYTWCKTADGSYEAEGAGRTVKNAWAGFYKAEIEAKANGNYYGKVDFPAKFKGDKPYYQIKQKDLYFGAEDVSKIYDAKAFTENTSTKVVDDVTFQPFGLVPADNTTTNVNAINEKTKAKRIAGSDEFDANVGRWEIVPEVTWSSFPGDIQNNYKYNENLNMNGFMEITPRTVKVTPQDLTDNIANPLTNFSTLLLQADDEDAAGYYTKYVKIDAKNDEAKTGVALGDAESGYSYEIKDILKGFTLSFTETHTDAGQWGKIIRLTPKATTGTGAYTGNYKIVAGDDANYVILGRTWAIFPKNAVLTYGDKVPDNLTYGTSGLGGVEFDDSGIKYVIKQVNAETGLEEVVNVPESGVLNVGDYLVYIDTENTQINAPANYSDPTIELNSRSLKINPKQVYAIPAEVAMNYGETEEDLNTLGKDLVIFATTATVDEGEEYVNGLVGKDKIKFNLAFKDGLYDENATTHVKTLKTSAVTTNDGITVVVPTTTADITAATIAGFANANYKINATATAKLVVGAYVLTLKDGDAQILDKIQVAAAKTTQKYNVKFVTDRKLAKQKWNAFVLPCDVDLNAVSNTLGYAIFNVYNEAASTANTVKFKLTMDKIPANTPFLVKTASEVTLKNITFEKVLIKNPESVNPSKEYKGKATAVGCYADTEITGNDYYFYNDSWQHGASTGEPTVLPMTMAYWTPAEPQNARVFVEDLDSNGTTVIREINTQSMTTVATDGWYTLNGVKLQGAPTEKGIYINNGKKIVTK